MSRPAVGPPSHLFSGCSFLEVKWPGCQVDHKPMSSAEVKNELSYVSAYPMCIRDMDKEIFTPCTFCSHW
jgi:hypothetical protein